MMIYRPTEADFTLVNMSAPNTWGHPYTKQILTDIKGETDRNSGTVGDFSIPLMSMNKSSEQKINKVTEILDDTKGTVKT